MNKTEIIDLLREKTGVTNAQLPTRLGVEEIGGVVTLSMGARSVTANMQADDAAFEGWVTCLKVAFPDWTFHLQWEPPENIEDKLYQRFLYRVKKFLEYYKAWFSIIDGCSIDDLRIKNGETYLLNRPSTPTNEDRTNDSTGSAENVIENQLVKDQPSALLDPLNIPKGQLQRQLPMGVFEGKVTTKNAIFAGRKSAVDLWAVSSDNELVMFELKAPGNEKVGVISELFFYAMVLADEQAGVFFRDSSEGEAIRNTKSLKAIILAEKVHSLITQGVFDLLNASFLGKDWVWTYSKSATAETT